MKGQTMAEEIVYKLLPC